MITTSGTWLENHWNVDNDNNNHDNNYHQGLRGVTPESQRSPGGLSHSRQSSANPSREDLQLVTDEWIALYTKEEPQEPLIPVLVSPSNIPDDTPTEDEIATSD
mmetsp:Transcript_8580/g.13608  ORF Transcript_8580/g.13608 Transcript_8580/m.13608 type:complete len:104 (-) Transcript_8580:42-353(-)